ncbi:hypothetical protein EUGRSUZ_B02172 [Eucalyptus grandis]|uniref:Uncharacterized protein n=2 Tax=Eucalyptus grandis TaxID=71139 RepID=A0A059D4C1_EUCGR|nr:hypothetical protein EUGRSUZ_B02172 [Eucalyptus grandis]
MLPLINGTFAKKLDFFILEFTTHLLRLCFCDRSIAKSIPQICRRFRSLSIVLRRTILLGELLAPSNCPDAHPP